MLTDQRAEPAARERPAVASRPAQTGLADSAEPLLRAPADDALAGVLARVVLQRAATNPGLSAVSRPADGVAVLQRVAVRREALDRNRVATSQERVGNLGGDEQQHLGQGQELYQVHFHANNYNDGNLISFTGAFTKGAPVVVDSGRADKATSWRRSPTATATGPTAPAKAHVTITEAAKGWSPPTLDYAFNRPDHTQAARVGAQRLTKQRLDEVLASELAAAQADMQVAAQALAHAQVLAAQQAEADARALAEAQARAAAEAETVRLAEAAAKSVADAKAAAEKSAQAKMLLSSVAVALAAMTAGTGTWVGSLLALGALAATAAFMNESEPLGTAT